METHTQKQLIGPEPIWKLRAKKCQTCPFLMRTDDDAKLVQRIVSDNGLSSTHPCHAQQLLGIDSDHYCRGHRDLLMQILHFQGVISAPTDEAYEEVWRARYPGKQLPFIHSS